MHPLKYILKILCVINCLRNSADCVIMNLHALSCSTVNIPSSTFLAPWSSDFFRPNIAVKLCLGGPIFLVFFKAFSNSTIPYFSLASCFELNNVCVIEKQSSAWCLHENYTEEEKQLISRSVYIV